MTLKASPLGNRVVWAKRIPPDGCQRVVALWKSAPTSGIPRCSGTLSGCDSWVRLTGGTRLARTPRLLSGDTFGVLTIRIVFVVLTCATFGSCSLKHRISVFFRLNLYKGLVWVQQSIRQRVICIYRTAMIFLSHEWSLIFTKMPCGSSDNCAKNNAEWIPTWVVYSLRRGVY